jgi:hypothetical protein
MMRIELSLHRRFHGTVSRANQLQREKSKISTCVRLLLYRTDQTFEIFVRISDFIPQLELKQLGPT